MNFPSVITSPLFNEMGVLLGNTNQWVIYFILHSQDLAWYKCKKIFFKPKTKIHHSWYVIATETRC